MLPKEDAETVSKKFSFLTVALLAYTAFCAVVAYNKAYTLPVAMVQGSVALSASKCLDGGLSQLFLLPCLVAGRCRAAFWAFCPCLPCRQWSSLVQRRGAARPVEVSVSGLGRLQKSKHQHCSGECATVGQHASLSKHCVFKQVRVTKVCKGPRQRVSMKSCEIQCMFYPPKQNFAQGGYPAPKPICMGDDSMCRLLPLVAALIDGCAGFHSHADQLFINNLP